MGKFITAVMLLFFSILTFGQEVDYLVKDYDWSKIDEYDKELLDSLLPIYQTSNEDTTKLRILETLSNELYDEQLWPKYNELLFQKSKALFLQDSSKVKIAGFYSSALNNKGLYQNRIGYFAEAISMYKESIRLDKKHGSLAINSALGNLGTVYEKIGADLSAIACYEESFQIASDLKDSSEMAYIYVCFSSVYSKLGKQKDALNNLFNALEIELALGDEDRVATLYNNLGLKYHNFGEYQLSKKYYMMALAIAQKTNTYSISGALMSNMASLYEEIGERDSAFYYLGQALEIDEDNNDVVGIAIDIGNLARLYKLEGNIDTAEYLYQKSLQMRDKVGDIEGRSTVLLNLANIYFDQGDTEKALKYATQAYSIDTSLGYPANIASSAKLLDKLYVRKGKWKGARRLFEEYMVMRDSIENVSLQKEALRKDMAHEHDKEMAIAQAQKEKEKVAAEAKLNRQRLVSIVTGLVLLLVIGFSFFVYRKMKEIAKQKLVIEEQKKEVEKQKMITEIKNQEIVDSINYAEKIQQALLQNNQEIEGMPEHFVLFKPKDIVSGDFYWIHEKKVKSKSYLYIAAADCTGHGVPGAFLTMLGTSFLNEINATSEVHSPGEILNQLRQRFIKELNQNGEEGESKDGMDVSLLMIEKESNTIQWAGANNPLWIVKNQTQELTEIKATKQPIGFYMGMTPFENHTAEVQKGDSLYMFSDGFVDQFGGVKGKKFMSKNFKKIVASIAHQPMLDQKEILDTQFEDWRVDYEQIDDVCVIGVRM